MWPPLVEGIPTCRSQEFAGRIIEVGYPVGCLVGVGFRPAGRGWCWRRRW